MRREARTNNHMWACYAVDPVGDDVSSIYFLIISFAWIQRVLSMISVRVHPAVTSPRGR